MISSRKKEVTPEKALIRLEELCVRAERCEAEVRAKLIAWRISQSDADAIVESLISRRFVDDSRYAAAFVRDKYRFSRWGRRRITMALRQKNIDNDTIDEALEQIDEDEYNEILIHLIKAKSRTMEQPLSYDDRNRLYRFGITRGFETQLVAKAVKGLML